MDNVSIHTKPDGGALPALLEKWIEQVIERTAKEGNISLAEIRDEAYLKITILKKPKTTPFMSRM